MDDWTASATAAAVPPTTASYRPQSVTLTRPAPSWLTITLLVIGLLGPKQGMAEAAGVTSERDARLDRGEAAGSVVGRPFAEDRRCLREAPGDCHQRVAMVGQALPRDTAAAADRR